MLGAKRKYHRRIYTIGAGQRVPLSIVASWFTVIASTKAFEVGIDGEDPQPIEPGLALNTNGYQDIVLRNPNAESITVDVAFTSNELRDSRLTASGVIDVRQVGVVDVKQVDEFFKVINGGALRSRGGSSFTGVVSSISELVSAAGNLFGLVIQTIEIHNLVAGVGYVRAGGVPIFLSRGVGAYSENMGSPIFLPAGTNLDVGGDGSTINMTYDIL